MRFEEELADFMPEKDMVLTIGVFDGVHLGHRHLISELVTQAGEHRMLAGVVTFKQHPEDLFSRGGKLPFLTSLEDRAELLRQAGTDAVIPLTFDEELARLSAREFVTLLQRFLRMRGLVVGPDFALGRKREGDIAFLAGLGQEMGFTVTPVPPLEMGGEVVSSTVIRQALSYGDVEKVRRLADRPFSLDGRVVTGAGRGVGLGFPTANLYVEQDQALPADGVYAGLAHIGDKTYQAMTNIGNNPTFNNKVRTVEAYIVDYRGDLYGQELRVDFIKRLRDEKRFDSAEALQIQLAEDVKRGREILGSEVGK